MPFGLSFGDEDKEDSQKEDKGVFGAMFGGSDAEEEAPPSPWYSGIAGKMSHLVPNPMDKVGSMFDSDDEKPPPADSKAGTNDPQSVITEATKHYLLLLVTECC